MRKVCLLAAPCLVALAFVSPAAAVPNVKLRAAVVPIPVNPRARHSHTYPGTGNFLGAAAALETEFKISGSEYGGFPSPLKEVEVFLPAGAKLHPQGFATCSGATLEAKGPEGCSKRSYASPPGEANGVVSFGGERVHEKVLVQGFFAPGGGLTFYVEGRSPVALDKLSPARVTLASGKPVVNAEVPLIETVPGAPAASAEQIKVKVGDCVQEGSQTDLVRNDATQVLKGWPEADGQADLLQRRIDHGLLFRALSAAALRRVLRFL